MQNTFRYNLSTRNNDTDHEKKLSVTGIHPDAMDGLPVPAQTPPEPDTYPNAELLLTAEQFAVQMLQDNTIVIDTRTSDSAYAASRIPGAVYFHSRSTLNDPDAAVDFFPGGPAGISTDDARDWTA